ncbi:MAG TPA: glycoside hydrolase family 2 TIM barrel-domain containing protein, partial [Planctomycetota bacterium]|nr:glycoside hydrolase family 2 TIM barrel-domain containing protein [Planctomycetota bacterium]
SLLLNGVWQVAYAPDGNPPADGWTRVRVPHRSREFENDPPASAWYRTQFSVPGQWDASSADVILDPPRVRHYARVYLAEPGKQPAVIGEHWGMRTPFTIKLTERVRPGATYDLLIYTHNCTGTYSHPSGKELSENAARALDSLFWYTGAATVGIEGDVWLRLEPRLRIDDIYVVTHLRTQETRQIADPPHWRKEKRIDVEVTVRNDTDAAADVRVEMAVVREGDVELKFQPQAVAVPAQESVVVRASQRGEKAIVWGRPPYGKPVLYFLRAELKANAKGQAQGLAPTSDMQVARFGFREIWTEGDKLLLNGEPLFPWGDHSIPYVHERQWLTRKLPDLAANGVSIVEHHRYDAPPVLYDVADELGMFVVSSNFCVGTGQVPSGLGPDEMKIILDHHREVADAWIRRDRNHPSILFWDVTDTWAPEYCVPLLTTVKLLDDTRMREVTYNDSPRELVDLVSDYRLFAGLDKIEASIKKIRAGELPVKPIRVGEAGIFKGAKWGYDEQPPMLPGWLDFINSLPGRNIHGLQTFHLTDMDYRGFTLQVPGMLSEPLKPKITWPAQSGSDPRIDPFGEGTQQAWGKAAIYLNWCDPSLPVSRPTATAKWWKKMYHDLTGRSLGPLSKTRVPEAIVTAMDAAGKPVPGAMVFVSPLEDQAMVPYGVKADDAGRAWFVLPEEGKYRFEFTGGDGTAASATAKCRRTKIDVNPGYGHIQFIKLEPRR